MRAYRKALLWIALTLVVGVALGAAGTLLTVNGWMRAPESGRADRAASRAEAEQRLIKNMAERLRLDAEQEQQVRKILDEGRNRFKELEKRKDAEVHSIRQEMNSQIRLLLRSDQQQSFEEFLEQLRKRRSRRESRPPEPAPPGR